MNMFRLFIRNPILFINAKVFIITYELIKYRR